MEHLDEGTIHSWIDGEVDAAQSREIEAHLAQCSTCSAAVAEARGLVAASSRILTALDDVPGGVVPKRVAPRPLKPARRQWRAARWVTGIAATLVLAVALNQLGRNGPEALLEDEVAEVRSEAARQALQSLADSAPVVRTTVPVLNSREAVQPPRVLAVRRDSTAAARPGDASAAVADAAMGALEAAKVSAAPAPPATAPQVAAANEPVAAQRQDRAATKSLAFEQVAATAAVGGNRAAEELENARFAGCYRIEPATSTRRIERIADAAGAAARVASATRGRAAPPAAAPSAAADFATPAAPSMVRLDTARHPLGFVVRNATTDASLGSWRGVGADSARVDLLAAGLYKLSLKNRVTCPER